MCTYSGLAGKIKLLKTNYVFNGNVLSNIKPLHTFVKKNIFLYNLSSVSTQDTEYPTDSVSLMNGLYDEVGNPERGLNGTAIPDPTTPDFESGNHVYPIFNSLYSYTIMDYTTLINDILESIPDIPTE
jgi:hypothetical protein